MLGALFLWSAMYKAVDPTEALSLVRWLCSFCHPQWVVKAAVLVEWAIGSILLIGYWSRSALVATAVLLTIFSIVLYAALHGGYTGGCGCVGIRMSVEASLIRNAVLIAIVAIAFWLDQSRLAYQSGSTSC
ncbi:MAG: hypothetical protein IPM33_08750 [Phycisphaerales bacterium]|nr:hypothetical protein [Phycisphaerales bacterium]